MRLSGPEWGALLVIGLVLGNITYHRLTGDIVSVEAEALASNTGMQAVAWAPQPEKAPTHPLMTPTTMHQAANPAVPTTGQHHPLPFMATPVEAPAFVKGQASPAKPQALLPVCLWPWQMSSNAVNPLIDLPACQKPVLHR